VVDKFTAPVMTPFEAATHLQIPERTMRRWLRPEDGRVPLVHSVSPERRGWPSLPFIALVEAYVLRALRDLGLRPRAIADAAEEVRREFGTEYGLATRRIATDGIDVFIHYLDSDELARAADRQIPIRGVVEDYLQYVTWDSDGFAQRLTLRLYDPAVAHVVIDPRFAWGAPIVEPAKVPVDAVVGMWRGGEPYRVVAEEYGLTVEQVQALIRVAA
jgi:uncharacterized protein (DUF433 family)